MKNNLLLMDKKDNVAIARVELAKGTMGILDGIQIETMDAIPQSHKIALVSIRKGDEIIRYGSRIGYATDNIEKGAWVHTHNLDSTMIMK